MSLRQASLSRVGTSAAAPVISLGQSPARAARRARAARASRAPGAAARATRTLAGAGRGRRAAALPASASETTFLSEAGDAAGASEPILSVRMDNSSDPFATVVTVEYGSRGASNEDLLGLVSAIRALGLHVKRARLGEGSSAHTFFLTDEAAEKVTRSAALEEVRLAILEVFERNHPAVAAAAPHAGAATSGRDPLAPLGVTRFGIRTQVEVREAPSARFSELLVNTTDRPGLLTDIVQVLKDINLNVVSAEVDTIGQNAFDRFNVTYHGEPLDEPMKLLAVNALQYYLSQSEVEKEWCESY